MISAAVLAFVLTGGMTAVAEAPCDAHSTEAEVAQLAPEELWAFEQDALFEDAEADFAARQDEAGLMGSTLATDAASADARLAAANTARGENPTEQK